MFIYVDLEHESLQQDAAHWESVLARRLNAKYRFEDMAHDHCLIVRYHQISPTVLHELKPRAIVVSGCASEYESYSEESLSGLRAVYRAAEWPILGLCAGMQLMAQAYGAPIGAMGPVANESATQGPNPFPEVGYRPGLKEEHGFRPVNVRTPHGLFEGLGLQPVFYESHYWEVKSCPTGFRVCAASEVCPIQVLAHESKPLFGTQFHPEAYDDAHSDGRRLLVNFFRMAGLTAA
jgi:GMP synthase-like glutamine amidotransferase